MSQDSFWWTTGGAGDGSATYTRADLKTVAEILAACHLFEGVAPDYLKNLDGSVPGANTARITDGGAIVDGKPYINTADEDVTIPSAVGVGNTRIDRIVLRADWTAQTVRITRIAGTDAATPSAPAITQTSGTTYDIRLYQALVDTSGTVTLTDEREMAQVRQASIEDGILSADTAGRLKMADAFVNTAKLADDSVDDTKAGNRVPQFYRRQGGSSSDWSSPGTTTYTPTSVRMQAGSHLFSSLVSGGSDVVSITFPTAFSNVPLVLCSFQISGSTPSLVGGALCWVSGVSASGFSLRIWQATGLTGDFEVTWFAVGPQ